MNAPGYDDREDNDVVWKPDPHPSPFAIAARKCQMALIRLTRIRRKFELLGFRQRWAKKFNEYECVGGPLDGRVQHCFEHSVHRVDRGHYEIDRRDCRLHFKEPARVSSWLNE